MRLNAQRDARVVIDTRAQPWSPSPEPGVDRVLLERIGDELALATSLVRYAPGARFASHEHGRGEELLVVEGEFCDEHGRYPAGTYLRNPPGSRHAPFSPEGCTLFVRLRQMPASERAPVCLPGVTRRCALGPDEAWHEVVLHATESERVSVTRWRAGHVVPAHAHPDGEDLFVLDGSFEDEHGRYTEGVWVRQPPGSSHAPRTSTGCLLLVKRGPRATD